MSRALAPQENIGSTTAGVRIPPGSVLYQSRLVFVVIMTLSCSDCVRSPGIISHSITSVSDSSLSLSFLIDDVEDDGRGSSW